MGRACPKFKKTLWDSVCADIEELKTNGEEPVNVNLAQVDIEQTPQLKYRFRRIVSNLPAIALFRKQRVYLLEPDGLRGKTSDDLVDFALESFEQVVALKVPPELSLLDKVLRYVQGDEL